MPDDTTPLADHVEQWMRLRGWLPISEGPAGRLWTRPKAKDDLRVGVFSRLEADSFYFQDLVDRLAAVHHIPAAEVATALKNWTVDVTYLKAAHDHSDSISLSAASATLETVRMMYRSAATSAVKPRPAINGSFSKLGDEVANQVRMGHTISGSYVIPVLVRVGEPDEPEPSLFPDEISTEMESLERRATRTFAQAFAAVHDEVVKPESSPSDLTLEQLVNRGVTREFTTAMARLLRHETVAELSAQFDWAPAQPAPGGLPNTVRIDAEAASKIATVSERLRNARMPRSEAFTGPVVVVAREPEDRRTHFAIRTVRHGRQCRIETVTSEPLDTILEWMRDRLLVQISGTVRRQGTGLVIEKPTSVEAFYPLPLPEE